MGYRIDAILNALTIEEYDTGYDGVEYIEHKIMGKRKAKRQINDLLLEARNNSLLDLERWIKLHDLGQEMILDGIEHMVISNLKVPDQPRLDNSERLAQLKAKQLGADNE